MNTNKNNPLITVVTVVYNGEQFLEKTILSVINQTYSNTEYIVIDGDSTDRTVEIINKYEHAIKYWVSEKDQGIYDAMNKGIEMATGEWINFMNCGDVFFNTDVLKQVFSHDLSNKDIVFGSTILDFDDKKTLIEASDATSLENSMRFCHQSAFVKTHKAKSMPFDLSYTIFADRHFFCKEYIARSSFFRVDKVISKISPHGHSSGNSIKFLKELSRLCSEFNINPFKTKFKIEYVRVMVITIIRKIFSMKTERRIRAIIDRILKSV